MPGCSSCRLLSLDGPTGTLTHGTFTDLLDKLGSGDFLVFNNARVIPARLFGCKASGGKIEMLAEWMPDDKHILARIHVSKASGPGAGLLLDDNENIGTTTTARHDALFEVESDDQRSVLDILSSVGYIPLPPYIDHLDEDADREFHQTVYNEKPGAVAAPTTGLHFDEPLLEKLRIKGAGMAFVTLHADAGAFQPARVDTVEDHIIHSEYAKVPQDVVDAVLTAKVRDNRMVVVDTTPMRPLEGTAQAAKNDLIEPFSDDTQIFIYPGFQYRVADAPVTSLRLPESMLIVLVLAFAGYQHAMDAYKAAIKEKYRLFSYGGAMFIMYNPQAINERVGE